MSILLREDGVQFAVQAHREHIPVTTTIASMRKHICALAEQYGSFVRLLKSDDNQYEAILSPEPGYLLGETVWHFYHRPHDLIYCEAIPNQEQAILIIINSGKVVFDNILPIANIIDQLTQLIKNDARYDIYIYGNLPIAQSSDKPGYVFNSDIVESFNILPEPLFSKLPVTHSLQLFPLKAALSEFKLNHAKYTIYAALALLISIMSIFTGYLWFSNGVPQQIADNSAIVNQPQTELQKPQQIVQAPRQSLQATPKIMTIAQQANPIISIPQQFNNISGMIINAFNIPGWIPQHISFDNNNTHLQLQYWGGTTSSLLNWADDRHMQISFTPSYAILSSVFVNTQNQVDISVAQNVANTDTTQPSSSKKLSTNDANRVIAAVIDRMTQILPGEAVEVSSAFNQQNPRAVNLTITFRDIAPNVLSLIGNQLADLPVHIVNGNADINYGLLTGNIEIAIIT